MNVNRHKSELEINDPPTQPLRPNTCLNPKNSRPRVASVSWAPAGSGRPGPPLPSTNLVLKQANRATHTHNTRDKSVPQPGQGELSEVFACLFMFCVFAFSQPDSCRSCRHPMAQSTTAGHGEHMIVWASTASSLHLFPSPSPPSFKTSQKP